MLERLTLPIEWKAEGADSGSLVGYLSTWDVDLGGDRVQKGAFTKAVAAIRKHGIPLLADHFAATSSVLGTIYDAAEDAKGLKIYARFSAAPSAQDVRIKLVEGHLNRFSMGYESMADHFEEASDGRRIRVLTDVKLWEGSVVVFPMNPEAAVTQAKSWVAGLPDDAASAVRKALADETPYCIEDGCHEPATATRRLSDDADELVCEAHKELPPDPGDAAGDEPAADAGDEPAESKSTAPGDEPGNATDEGAAGWDHWTSEALLAGRPVATADPAEVAGLRTRLALAEKAGGKEG